MTSYKRLFSRALAAAPERLHMAAHSHHLWPDATRAAHIEAWDDAARLADRKWDKVLGEVWPRAQAGVARQLCLPSPDTIVFSSNTHDLILRLVSALARRPARILTSDREFHSFRRQAARWSETGEVVLDVVNVEPFDTFGDRFLAAARAGGHDLIFVSHVFFDTGEILDRIGDLATLSSPSGPWVAIDGYHAFMAFPVDLSDVADRIFYIAGGYKYAMAGEGAAFMHAPPGYGARPAATGWYAEFAGLSGPPGKVVYADDARRFMGSTFDPSGIYRLAAVFDLLDRERLDTGLITARIAPLRVDLADRIGRGEAGALGEAKLVASQTRNPAARFLSLRHPDAARWQAALAAADVTTDVRGEILRIGLGLYHDPEDIQLFCAAARQMPV